MPREVGNEETARWQAYLATFESPLWDVDVEHWTLNVERARERWSRIENLSSPLKLRRHVTLLNSQHGNSLFFVPTTSMRCLASKHPSSLTTLLITARYQAAEGHKDARWAPTVPFPLLADHPFWTQQDECCKTAWMILPTIDTRGAVSWWVTWSMSVH